MKNISTFINELNKNNSSICLGLKDNEVVCSKAISELNIPDGYTIENGIISKDDKEIGTIVNKERDYIISHSKDYDSFYNYYDKKIEPKNNSKYDEDDDLEDTNDLDVKAPKRRFQFKNLFGRIKNSVKNFFGIKRNNKVTTKEEGKELSFFGKIKRRVVLLGRKIKGIFKNNNKRVVSKDDNTKDDIEEDKNAILENKLSEIELIIKEIKEELKNKNIDSKDYKDRISSISSEYDDYCTKLFNNETIDGKKLIELKSKAVKLKSDIDAEVNTKKNETNTKTEAKKFEFTSIDDTKAKFEEFDSDEKELVDVKEKIAYYEDFLKNHDLSHVEDQGMKERMEAKLKELKERYNKLTTIDKKAINDDRSMKMAYYTQIAKGIDSKVNEIEIDRQIRLLQFKKDPNAISLDAEETRSIYAKKKALLELKKECLERKAKIYEQYANETKPMINAYREAKKDNVKRLVLR